MKVYHSMDIEYDNMIHYWTAVIQHLVKCNIWNALRILVGFAVVYFLLASDGLDYGVLNWNYRLRFDGWCIL